MGQNTQAGWQNNVKQIFRVALIGLQPSQQLIVKGYLRVLLRVDFDLEWVPPKHDTVDLYIINHQFAHAESVTKLLTTNDVPALFVDERDDIKNTIKNNTIYLKLTDIHLLENWLQNNVSMIGADGAYVNVVLDESRSTMSVQSELADREVQETAQKKTINKTLLKEQTQGVKQSPLSRNMSGSGMVGEHTLELLRLVNEHQSDAFYDVYDADKPIAVIHPQKRMVWPKGDSFFPSYSVDWQVVKLPASHVENNHSLNISQWLWQCALESQSMVSDILPRHSKLRLKTWPKPLFNSNKSDYLKIISLIEMKAFSTEELSELFGLDIIRVHKLISALYLAGFLDTSHLGNSDSLARLQLQQQVNPVQEDELPRSESEVVFEESSTSASPVSEEAPVFITDEQIKQRKKVVEQSGGFGGLLSRIRSSLGF